MNRYQRELLKWLFQCLMGIALIGFGKGIWMQDSGITNTNVFVFTGSAVMLYLMTDNPHS